MDINGGRVQGFMSKDCLDGKKVCAVFVKMGSQGMPERMTGNTSFPSEPVFVFMDMPGQEEGVDWPARVSLFREKPSHGSPACEPVLRKDAKSILRQDGIALLFVFRVKDMYPHAGAVDVFIAEMADFTDPKAGGIHDSNHCLLFDVRDGADKFKGFLLRGNKRKICIESALRKLGVIPWFVEDVHGEETKLGNGTVDGAVSKIPFLLKPLDVVAQFLPRSITRLLVKNVFQVIKIGADICTVAF